MSRRPVIAQFYLSNWSIRIFQSPLPMRIISIRWAEDIVSVNPSVSVQLFLNGVRRPPIVLLSEGRHRSVIMNWHLPGLMNFAVRVDGNATLILEIEIMDELHVTNLMYGGSVLVPYEMPMLFSRFYRRTD